MTYYCARGCVDVGTKDGRMIHYSKNECPAETYNPSLNPGRSGHMNAKGHPGLNPNPPPLKPPAPDGAVKVGTITPVPGTSMVTFTERKADVTKGATKPATAQVVDYILDWPRSKALWNLGFRGLYFVHLKIDVWVFGWEPSPEHPERKHLPKEQFALSKNSEMAAEQDPRNMYARAATWFCKNICRAPNLERAQQAVDSILFFEAFGGIFVAIIFHYENVYRHSPKLEAARVEKKRRAEAKLHARDAEFRVVAPPQGLPA